MKKMEPLNQHLLELSIGSWRPTFEIIEQVLGFHLPNSARNYAAWWSNDATPGRQSWAWLDAGFRTAEVDLERSEITFSRQSTPQNKPAPKMYGSQPQTGELSHLTATRNKNNREEIRPLLQQERYDLALVSCVKTKCSYSCAAKDLYVSPRFKKSRMIAECYADRWFILSALHGLVAPDDVIFPYEQALKNATAAEQRKWAQKVFQSICSSIPEDSTILILAGSVYCRQLVPLLKQRGYYVSQPLEGLSQGLGLSWLSKAAALCP